MLKKEMIRFSIGLVFVIIGMFTPACMVFAWATYHDIWMVVIGMAGVLVTVLGCDELETARMGFKVIRESKEHPSIKNHKLYAAKKRTVIF